MRPLHQRLVTGRTFDKPSALQLAHTLGIAVSANTTMTVRSCRSIIARSPSPEVPQTWSGQRASKGVPPHIHTHVRTFPVMILRPHVQIKHMSPSVKRSKVRTSSLKDPQ